MDARSVVAVVLGSWVALAGIDACGGGTEPNNASETADAAADAVPTPVRADFGLDQRPVNATCKAPARPPSTAPVKFQRVFANVQLAAPMMMAQIPGDGSRWFVALRDGTVASFPVAAPPNVPAKVADIGVLAGIAVNEAGEGGLLGMAFHPKFAQNGRLYVTWTKASGPTTMQSEVGYISSTDNGATFGNYQVVLGPFAQPAQNHNGGGIAFGKDGYLYLSFGDGGGGDDQFQNGQSKTGFFSKILRIDVDNVPGGQTYGIPADNPFQNPALGEPATFARGFRNPFRFSIDRESNEVWVGDVGQNHYEEIDAKIQIGGNYGWSCREGMHDYITPTAETPPSFLVDPNRCPSMAGLIDPIVEHEHMPANSRAIVGGVVYRGKAVPAFVGNYVYGDYVKQELWALTIDPSTGQPQKTQINDQGPAASWVSFAEDVDGEVYALALNQGAIYQLVAAAPPTPSTFPDRLSKTGCVDPNAAQNPAPGLIPYGVNAALWSDGAEKERFLALPDGQTITVQPDGDFDFPPSTVLMKTFSLGGKRVETRLFMRHDDGAWAGYSYEWLDDESDAVLLPSSKTKPVGAQTWTFPSRSDCISCHSEAAGRSLGLELGQQNGDFVYPSTNRISNQLRTFEHIGLFSQPLGQPIDQIVAYPDPFGGAAGEGRARAYLHANCANCHRPKGPGLGNVDLRFATALVDTKTCNVDPAGGDLGVAGAKILVPGAPENSLLSLRPHSPAANRMPPLASRIVDDKGLGVVDDWIRSLSACP